MTYISDAYTNARTYLMSDATELPDATLAVFETEAEEILCAMYPCITNGGVTTTLTSTTDLTNLSRALGYAIAMMIARNPIGNLIISSSIEAKVGPVTRKFGNLSAKDFADFLDAECRKAMLRIVCIRAVAAAQARGFTQYGLAGHRRTIGEPWSIQGKILGSGGFLNRVVVNETVIVEDIL